MKNLPVPATPRAPINPAWFVMHGPPAAIVWAYRSLIPAYRRRNWNHDVSTSHKGMADVLAPGNGWKALAHYATPQIATRRRHRFAIAWALFLLVPALRIEQSWAN